MKVETDEMCCAAQGEPTPQWRIVADELDMMKTAGVIEVAVRNPNVAEYMRHWEGRVLAAEHRESAMRSRIEKLREIIGTNIVPSDGPHTATLPDGSVHSGPVVDYMHELFGMVAQLLDHALTAPTRHDPQIQE